MREVIYIGPNVKGTPLKRMTVFIDGIPEEYKNHKIYKHLFVSFEETALDRALAEVERKGSKLNIFYEQAIRGEK